MYIWVVIGPKVAGAAVTMRMVVTEQLPPPSPPSPPPAPPSPPPPPPDSLGTWENPIDVQASGDGYDSGIVTYFKLQTPPSTCGFLDASAPVLVYRYLVRSQRAGPHNPIARWFPQLDPHPRAYSFILPFIHSFFQAPAYMVGGTLVMDAQWGESLGDSVFSVLYSFAPTGTRTCLG